MAVGALRWAVRKFLLFGRHATSDAMHFAVGMVGAKPLVVNEPPSLKNLYFDF